MANWNPSLVTPTLTSAPASGGGTPAPNGAVLSRVQPQHGVVFVVLLATAILLVLDRAGFKFVFTAGKR